MLEQLVLIIHIIAAISILGLILIQHGKGAEMGASFGSGGSQTVLGVQGGGNLLTRSTAILSAIFFATSLTLGYFAKQESKALDGFTIDEPAIEQVIDVESDNEIPVLMDSNSADEIPVEEMSAEEVPVIEESAEIPSDDGIPSE
jgi:preprotein translocase subunit SecG